MEKEVLTPEKSMYLITQVISEARNKFEENGFIYLFWGALLGIVSLAQFILIKQELFSINWYPYLLMPLGAIYTFVYFLKKKGKRKQNQISRTISFSWIVISFNMMILGFLFYPYLKENLIPVILILLSVGIIMSGSSLNSKVLLLSGALINFSAFIGFYVDLMYQPLLMSIVSFAAVFVPGVFLMIQHKKA
ncbi:MAG: hypothetical protein L3J74_06300 [Bacteroidales bacterium]|nr:hypothetical protein [Bacteroidales bacterium]